MIRLPTLALALAAGLMLLGPATAADKGAEIPPDADGKALKNAEERFRREYDTADIDFKLEAIQQYAKTQHPTIAKKLLKLMKDKDEHVRAEAATGLGLQLSYAKKAGPKLVKFANEKEESPKGVRRAVLSIGRLEYRKADKDLKKLIHHVDDGVVAAVFEVYGMWKSDLAIREMLDFFTKYPDEKSFATGTVTVDTGAAGNEDQKAAQAKWKAKYGGQRNWRPRPECTRALVAALKEITGYGFRRPEDLKRYIDEPEDYRDPEKVAERVDDEKRMKLYATWHGIKKRAEQLAAQEVKGEEESKERAKVYRKHLYRMRDDLLAKNKLILSELDVIVEEGEERNWAKTP